MHNFSVIIVACPVNSLYPSTTYWTLLLAIVSRTFAFDILSLNCQSLSYHPFRQKGWYAMARTPKVNLKLYSHFLIANQNRYSRVELARVAPDVTLAHDAVSRWLGRGAWNSKRLWQAAKPLVTLWGSYLVGDDTVVGKAFSRHNPLVKRQYSGQVHRLVNGIVNLLWTDGECFVPVDYRVYQDELDHLTKHDHFRSMLDLAEKRGFAPGYVLMDSWYGALPTLKRLRDRHWPYQAVADLDWDNDVAHRVWLKGYGMVKVARLVLTNGDTRYLATGDLSLTRDEVIAQWRNRWAIETMHRGLKQTTGIGGNYAITEQVQRTHIFSAFWPLLKLERCRISTGLSWYDQVARIHRGAVTDYLRRG